MKIIIEYFYLYNVEKYLKEYLDSVINQTYKNLQVILIDDSSIDENSLNISKNTFKI